jgi:hypothetical protein
MLRGDSQEASRRNGEHKRWLAMQSAHEEYQRSSEALEYLAPLSRDSTTDERLLKGVLQDRQRAAFERYLDARMEFLEFRFDEGERRRTHSLALVRKRIPAAVWTASWLKFGNGRPFVSVLAAAMLLCAAALYYVHQQNRVRELEAARNELWAALKQARDEAQAPSHSRTQTVEYAPEPTRRPPPTVVPKPQRLPHKQASVKIDPISAVQIQSIGARTYYSFSLEPSSQFQRVGPIQISLRSLDVQRSYVSLSIMSGPVKVEVQRLRLSHPLWIGDAQRQQPLELVADRIGGKRLYGRVIETRDKPDLRASRLKNGLSSNP